MSVRKRLGAVALFAATLTLSLTSAAAARGWRHEHPGRWHWREHAAWEHDRAYPVRTCHEEWRRHHRVNVCRYVYR